MNNAEPAASEAYRRAISAYEAGELAKAEQICFQIVATEQKSFDAIYLLAAVQTGLGKMDAALASCDRAIAMRPDHAEACCKHGNLLYQLKRFAEAVASYDRAIALRPDYAEAYANRGIGLHAMKRYEDAVASYDRAIALRPDYATAFHNRAIALQQMRRFGDAVASYDRALLLRSGDGANFAAEMPSDRRGTAPARRAARTPPAGRDGRLTVLSHCSFPPIGPDAVGGAEQILTMLDRALVEAGHRSIVLACEGSRPAGTLVEVPGPYAVPGGPAAALIEHRAAILAALERWRVDLVHLHGSKFHALLPLPGVPVLATLHLPVTHYHLEALRPQADTFLHCVSARQHADCGKLADMPHMLAPIENGIVLEDYEGRHAKRSFALLLCRISPAKGVHLAIDAAKHAGVPLLIAGEVSPEPDMEAYFRDEVQPRLDRARRFIGPAGLRRKRRLLAAARCLLVPSLFAETGSLVAREALAAGTPVVAFRAGVLVDVVGHGRTGYLVEDVQQMAEAIAACANIDPALCRRVARERFSARRMIEQYFSVYEALTGVHAGLAAAGP